MSQILGTLLGACPNVQTELETAFLQAPVREPLPFLEAVGANSSQLNQIVNPSSNKTKTVTLRYDQDIAESSVTSNGENPKCAATTQRGDKTVDYSLDTNVNVQVEQLIEIRDLERICRDNPTYFGPLVDRLVYALDKKLATNVAGQAAVLNGKWASDVSVTSNRLIINTLITVAGGVVNPLAQADLDQALIQTGYSGDALVFGGTTLWKYMRAMEAGCCADSGINLLEISRMYGKSFAYDRRLATALGGNDYNMVIKPNSFSLLQYTLNGWSDQLPAAYQSGAYYKTVIQSPRSGVAMDLTIKDDCGNVSIILTATTKLVAMPTDMYPVGDVYEGVNYVNLVKVTNT